MKAYHRLGIDGFMTETLGAAAAEYKTFHLPLYVAARLLYNVAEDVDRILRDYCRQRFGPAGETMFAYFKTLESGLDNMDGCLKGKPAARFEDFFTPEVIEKARPLLLRALDQADEYSREVEKELALFNEWQTIRIQRQKDRAVSTTVTALPLPDMAIDCLPEKDLGLTLTDSKLLISPRDWPTLAFVFSDQARAGFIIDCAEPAMAELKIAGENSANCIYGKDCLEIFLSRRKGDDVCYHVLVSPGGAYALCECAGTRWNWSWQADCRVESRKYRDRWRILFSLPKAAIGSSGPFAFSLVRNRHIKEWQIAGLPGGGAYFNTANYCEVTV
jgi:hypothetical protein